MPQNSTIRKKYTEYASDLGIFWEKSHPATSLRIPSDEVGKPYTHLVGNALPTDFSLLREKTIFVRKEDINCENQHH